MSEPQSTRETGDKPVIYQIISLPEYVQQWVDAECEVIRHPGRGRASREELVENLPKVVGVLTSNQVKIDNDLIVANPQLRVIANIGVGYDNVDVPFATEHGVLVCNTPDVLTDAVADLAYGFILGLTKRIVLAHEYMRAGNWSKGVALPVGVDLRGKTLGILGFGRIGHAVARRAAPFGMEVVYYDPVRDPVAEDVGLARYAERDDVIRSADILTLHMFLDEATRKHFGRRELELMKPTAYLINTSRGPVLDQEALVEALQEKRIAGAGLDVFEVEPLPADSPLLQLDNVMLGPHMATATVETRLAMQERAARNIIAAVNGRTPEAMVNPEALGIRARMHT